MKESDKAWETRQHPLIDLNMSRDDCAEYIESIESIGETVPPKSACLWCPYHNNAFWRDMRDNRPEEWESACVFDEQIRGFHEGGRLGVQNPLFVHASLEPLRFANLEPLKQGEEAENPMQMDLFEMIGECGGMCGV